MKFTSISTSIDTVLTKSFIEQLFHIRGPTQGGGGGEGGKRQRARVGNSTICYRKKQIDVSF